MLWRGALFTEDMSSIYACKHAETIENAVWQTSIFLLILSQRSFIVLYGPVCLSSTLRNIKKITWAQHCSKWQANALGISKKTLRVRTYIHRRLSCLQTTTVFTIYSFSMFDFFFFFFLFIITCHMRSLDYKSTWTNCLYISMHSCFLIYILFTDSKKGGKDQQHVFLSYVLFTFLGRGTESGATSICRVFRTCTPSRISVGLSKCVYSQWLQFKKKERSKKRRCSSQLHLWPELLHCVTTVYFFPFVWGCLSGGGLERLIYDVNCAVKGKANRG